MGFLREFKINLILKESSTKQEKKHRDEKVLLSLRKQLGKIKHVICQIRTLSIAAFFHRYTRMSSELHSLVNCDYNNPQIRKLGKYGKMSEGILECLWNKIEETQISSVPI